MDSSALTGRDMSGFLMHLLSSVNYSVFLFIYFVKKGKIVPMHIAMLMNLLTHLFFIDVHTSFRICGMFFTAMKKQHKVYKNYPVQKESYTTINTVTVTDA